ncbi:hypothetical protein E2C01_026171 [Portunus trituberculatus]|uniref:Uncharacterized protein n=1 Tax=Portunus trituberculatus TaxID=210409 RepID=A0A5B7EER6_PORTR|nr:hypothetical protein [Portunus trituberculatus]
MKLTYEGKKTPTSPICDARLPGDWQAAPVIPKATHSTKTRPPPMRRPQHLLVTLQHSTTRRPPPTPRQGINNITVDTKHTGTLTLSDIV